MEFIKSLLSQEIHIWVSVVVAIGGVIVGFVLNFSRFIDGIVRIWTFSKWLVRTIVYLITRHDFYFDRASQGYWRKTSAVWQPKDGMFVLHEGPFCSRCFNKEHRQIRLIYRYEHRYIDDDDQYVCIWGCPDCSVNNIYCNEDYRPKVTAEVCGITPGVKEQMARS